MSFYEERLAEDRAAIISELRSLGDMALDGIRTAAKAVLTDDKELAAQTMINDHPINRLAEDVDRMCHHFVARHLPSAGHLRFISSVLRMTIALERVGDYAVTIAREASVMDRPLQAPLDEGVAAMSERAIKMLEKSLQAFESEDIALAHETMKVAKAVDRDFEGNFQTLVRFGESGQNSVKDLLRKVTVFNMLERVSDQAKNLCEDVVFWLSGETKKRRPVEVLFVDSKHGFASKLAAAIGSKVYPGAGNYYFSESQSDPRLNEFFERTGLATSASANAGTDPTWKDYDVVISLDGPVEEHVSDRPFRTILLSWDLAVNDDSPDFEDAYRDLSNRIFSLMDIMRGKGALDDD